MSKQRKPRRWWVLLNRRGSIHSAYDKKWQAESNQRYSGHFLLLKRTMVRVEEILPKRRKSKEPNE